MYGNCPTQIFSTADFLKVTHASQNFHSDFHFHLLTESSFRDESTGLHGPKDNSPFYAFAAYISCYVWISKIQWMFSPLNTRGSTFRQTSYAQYPAHTRNTTYIALDVEKFWNIFRFQVLTAVIMKTFTFLDKMWYSIVRICWIFGDTYASVVRDAE
jgi:hypothetical protein